MPRRYDRPAADRNRFSNPETAKRPANATFFDRPASVAEIGSRRPALDARDARNGRTVSPKRTRTDPPNGVAAPCALPTLRADLASDAANFGTIIVEAVDRLTRRLSDFQALEAAFEARGIDVGPSRVA